MVKSIDDVLLTHLIDFGEVLEFNNYLFRIHFIVLTESPQLHFE